MTGTGGEKRTSEGLLEDWKTIVKEMDQLLQVWQDFARGALGLMDARAIDMQSLGEPRALSEVIQDLRNAFDENAYKKCWEDICQDIKHKVTKALWEASRDLGHQLNLVAVACAEDRELNLQDSNKGREFSFKTQDSLKKVKDMMEYTEREKEIIREVSIEPEAMRRQLLRQALQERQRSGLTVEGIRQYISIVQKCKAEEMLKDFLLEVEPMTQTLQSSWRDLEPKLRVLRNKKKRAA